MNFVMIICGEEIEKIIFWVIDCSMLAISTFGVLSYSIGLCGILLHKGNRKCFKNKKGVYCIISCFYKIFNMILKS